ncbi:nitroreductase family protein [Parvicella tangerina]|uniref:Putative NAD(P)H nitroreductase n=1 Tax=Parvicella tangerina TaxID=2829795 RepID=A0A916NF31_9FLAO|nr:nitroreductase [Parvicella tangerina]CAG5076790.1 Putative NAD(P)H nitroreductase YdjA [Parvicella tangerina]
MKYNLSEITEVIQNRRTIFPEQYSERKVHREIVEKILNNAVWAPSHGMTQPWRFRVYMNDQLTELSDFLSNTYKEFIGDNFDQGKFDKIKRRPLLSSAVIVVNMARDKREKILEIEEVEAVACAVQNMYLTATAYGIGGFWSTPKFIYTDLVKEFFELGENDKCLGIFYLGYPKEEIGWPKGQRKPIEYVTKWVGE